VHRKVQLFGDRGNNQVAQYYLILLPQVFHCLERRILQDVAWVRIAFTV